MATTFEPTFQECVKRLGRDRRTNKARSEAGDVGVVVLSREAGRGHVVNDRGTGAVDLVRRDRNADPRATYTDSEIGLARHHAPGDSGSEVRVVDRLRRVSAEVHDIVPKRGQMTGEKPLQLEPGMVRPDTDAHAASLGTLGGVDPGRGRGDLLEGESPFAQARQHVSDDRDHR